CASPPGLYRAGHGFPGSHHSNYQPGGVSLPTAGLPLSDPCTDDRTPTMCADTPAAPDYRDSVFLPETDFPMRAGLPAREPDWLARWERLGIYDRLRAQAGDRKPFILHDGPPYANGHLHIG